MHVYICFNYVEMAANEYSGILEEARENARIRNAYFEQVYSKMISTRMKIPITLCVCWRYIKICFDSLHLIFKILFDLLPFIYAYFLVKFVLLLGF